MANQVQCPVRPPRAAAPISRTLRLPFLCRAWPQGERTAQPWTSFTPATVFYADGRNAARKWRIEINNWRPITVPLNDFHGSPSRRSRSGGPSAPRLRGAGWCERDPIQLRIAALPESADECSSGAWAGGLRLPSPFSVTEANGSQVEFVPWRSQKRKSLELTSPRPDASRRKALISRVSVNLIIAPGGA